MAHKKKPTRYEARLDQLPDRKIYLNVAHLEKGLYEIHIVHRNQLLVKTHFKKK